MPKSSIQPVAGYLLVEPLKAKMVTPSGIILPESHEEKPQSGKVLMVGDDFVNDYGTKKTSPAKVGDIVIYKEGWGGEKYKDGETSVLLLKFDEIMAIIK